MTEVKIVGEVIKSFSLEGFQRPVPVGAFVTHFTESTEAGEVRMEHRIGRVKFNESRFYGLVADGYLKRVNGVTLSLEDTVALQEQIEENIPYIDLDLLDQEGIDEALFREMLLAIAIEHLHERGTSQLSVPQVWASVPIIIGAFNAIAESGDPEESEE